MRTGQTALNDDSGNRKCINPFDNRLYPFRERLMRYDNFKTLNREAAVPYFVRWHVLHSSVGSRQTYRPKMEKTMKFIKILRSVATIGVFGLAAAAHAQETIKVGVIAAFSGPFADYGKQMEGGIKAWMAQNGVTVAGKKIEIIYKDTTGPSPEIAKRLAQELVVRDKVDFLAGFGLTPEALAVAPIAEQAKKPMIVMNAATSIITTKSSYIARFSMTLPQISAPMATWAAKNGIKKVVTLVADYGPGIDAEAAFKNELVKGGGTVTEAIRVPLRNPEFAPYIQRIKDAKPDAVFIFVPAGEQGIAF